jgi:hypothetical protein
MTTFVGRRQGAATITGIRSSDRDFRRDGTDVPVIDVHTDDHAKLQRNQAADPDLTAHHRFRNTSGVTA